jgi:predicted DNA-binding antitoxin AbrB/MazE fold protein
MCDIIGRLLIEEIVVSTQHFDAIFEKGVLRPLQPLGLAEHERVSLVIAAGDNTEASENDTISDYIPLICEDGDPNITWEQVQALLAKLPFPLSSDFERERDERF